MSDASGLPEALTRTKSAGPSLLTLLFSCFAARSQGAGRE